MKIVGFTMMTNPEYRQDPWRESIAQALEVFDEVVVVYGREEDGPMLAQAFPGAPIKAFFLEWPQPEWTYDELPRHLNLALQVIRQDESVDWAIKFDLDHLFHEGDKRGIRDNLARLHGEGKMLAMFEKYQFFKVDKAYEKGKMPFGINMRLGKDIWYGYDEEKYTDLCQPIIWDRKNTVMFRNAKHPTPKGKAVPDAKKGRTSIHVWNYDYTFKTKERAMELLYHFERSHAHFWVAGQYGAVLEDITPEYALENYLTLARDRFKRCIKPFAWSQHPKHIQQRVKHIKKEEFGYNLWGIV